MSSLSKRTGFIAILVTLLLAFGANQFAGQHDTASIKTEQIISPMADATVSAPEPATPVSPFAAVPLLGALFIPGMAKRKVQFKRRNGGRAFTQAKVADATVAFDNAGGQKLAARRFQSGLRLKTRRVQLTLTGVTGAANFVIFDFAGVSNRTLTNVTVGGTFTTSTESALRQWMGTNPFYIGKVWVGVSVSTMWNSINLQFITKQVDGTLNQVPFNSFFLQNPMNTNTLLNITDPINVLADSGFAMSGTLANTEVLSLGFEIPEQVTSYAMSN